MNKFCELIKIKRAEANLTQGELADYMGVSVIAVQSWESGRTKIKEDRLSRLAEVLHVDESELLNRLKDTDEDFSNWPAFLFTEEQNEIISSIRLSPEHKRLLMLLRIYNADNWDRKRNEALSWDANVIRALRRIPYKYTEDVGVYTVYEMGLHLEKFLKYVPGEFCIDLIRKDPNTEFDLRKLGKKDILKWLDLLIFTSRDEKTKYDRYNYGFSKRFYSSLVYSITNFKEESRKFDNYRSFNFDSSNQSRFFVYDEYIAKVHDKESLTITTTLTEKGKLFQEWCKDIDL